MDLKIYLFAFFVRLWDMTFKKILWKIYSVCAIMQRCKDNGKLAIGQSKTLCIHVWNSWWEVPCIPIVIEETPHRCVMGQTENHQHHAGYQAPSVLTNFTFKFRACSLLGSLESDLWQDLYYEQRAWLRLWA